MYEKAHNHYHYRLGLDTPFTQKAAEKNRPETGRRDPLQWGTLMFYQQPFPAPPKK